MEEENVLQDGEVSSFTVTSDDTTIIQSIDTLNHNIVTGFMFLIGTVGIVVGVLIGKVFNGIFRSK